MAGWDIISAISYGQNLLPEEKYTMAPGRVSDTLLGDAKSWFDKDFRFLSLPQPILIKAPTGSGKSTFVMRDLAELLREQIPYGRILLLTNRKALCLQQRMIGNTNSSLPRLGTTSLSGNPIWDNIDIISYQEAVSYITHDYYGTIGQVRIVVCDEAHFFCSDSTYNAHTSEILQLIIQRFFWHKRIYMTATPDDVKPIIEFEEKQAINFYVSSLHQQDLASCQALASKHKAEQELIRNNKGNFQKLLEEQQLELNIQNTNSAGLTQKIQSILNTHKIGIYEYPDDFSYVRLHFVHEWESIIHSIKDNSDDKWLIFVSTEKLGEKLKSEIGPSANFFNADSKGEDKKAFQDLIRRECFDTNVLISTTVLYNGVNFNDACLKHIVVDSISKVELIQMLGRKRLNREENETVNLYVMVPEEKNLSSRLGLIKLNIEMTQSFQRDPFGFFRDKWEKQNVDDNIQRLFGVPDVFQGTFINMSLYAPYELGLQEGMHETCLDALKKGNHAFEDLVCNWLHTEYSDEMKYDEDLEDMKGKIKPALIACFEKYKEKSPFSQENGKAFWQEIYDIVIPINETLNYHFGYLDSDGQSRWKADINAINKKFSLPYEVNGGKKKGFSVTLGAEKPIKSQSTDETDNPTEIPPESEETETEEI